MMRLCGSAEGGMLKKLSERYWIDQIAGLFTVQSVHVEVIKPESEWKIPHGVKVYLKKYDAELACAKLNLEAVIEKGTADRSSPLLRGQTPRSHYNYLIMKWESEKRKSFT